MAERRKKLIEVALPLEAINKEAAREKYIRHGHPSTLHLWWARRPLAACRAVLFAQLVDDPDSDPAFRRLDGTVDAERAGLKRAELFNLIEELVKWENSNDPKILNKARAEIARCVASRKIERGELTKDTVIVGDREGQKHPKGPVSGVGATAWEVVLMTAPPETVNHFLAAYAPPVLDPFAGGGSIPLEAQRLGLRAYASDLNPVAVLINKALIEIPPKFANKPPVNPDWQAKSKEEKAATLWHGARGLAEDVRYYGQWMRDEAEKRIGHLYPKVEITPQMANDRPDLKPYVGRKLTVIAWLWAKTVASPDPAVGGVHVPLVTTFWLSTRKGKEAYIRPIIDKDNKAYRFQVYSGKPKDGFDPDKGTVVRTGATCLLSGSAIPFDHVRLEGKADRMRQRLMAIVCEGQNSRVYLSPTKEQEQAVLKAEPIDYPLTDIPDKALGFRVQLYGMNQHWKLFSARQLAILCTLSDLIKKVKEEIFSDAKKGNLQDSKLNEYAEAVVTYLAFAVDKAADYWSVLCSWHTSGEKMRNTFGRQALPMVWDYAECCPFSSSTGNWMACVDWVWKVTAKVPASLYAKAKQADVIADDTYSLETVKQADAASAQTYAMLPIISSDPPYYDNIGYADLSDFFYVWLRRSLKDMYPMLFNTLLTPKAQELIATPHRHDEDRQKASKFFEDGLSKAIHLWRERGYSDYPTTIFYAFKQAESDDHGTASTGWETFLNGVIDANFMITGTWPMRTEMGNRMVGAGTNALASSVVLSCVPRQPDAPLATRREFLQALKAELPDALKKLQSGSIAPVDLAQAAIGPGMGVFSRYAKVIEADGEPMRVRAALTLINQVLDEVLAEQEGEFDADTRWAVAWFEQHGVDEGPYGVAETLSKAKNTSVQGLVEAGVLTARGGKVKLLARSEMKPDWDPTADKRPTGWEAVQYLIRVLETDGEQAAATLLRKLGGLGEIARELAYRLYAICERKKWANEALAYNSLIVAWPEISKLARTTPTAAAAGERGLFE